MSTELTTKNAIFGDPKYPQQYTSFKPDTMEGKMKLYNAINSPEKRIADFINTPIYVKDVVVMAVELTDKFVTNDANGPWEEEDNNSNRNVRHGFRVILIDTDDVAYTATSNGIYNSVKVLLNVFGTLHFEEGLKMIVKQVQAKNGNTLTLSLK